MERNIIEINEEKIQDFVDSKRPQDPELRKKIDFGYSFDRKAFEIFTTRPIWINPSKTRNYPFARLRYYQTRNEWNLYWMRANGKWEAYSPFPKANNLSALLEIINEDKLGCFFG
ncbi:DUF3024 domain-containing protein [Luteibaculum oceani]|uniref:DUF3024 domain-containing protein n=1 Tax=Luteibaculum oceani TaxID=1294296 RepID=A0A5C6V1Y6_9FLAO|nr:DUF3024 domain-containing protein [Luteibaculum oceani]TXC77025.1 DUF3024 domain-containing protein [Luteibaculum oceani]